MESIIKRENLRSELEFLKELFLDKLPIGDKKRDIEKYFSKLEEVIDNKDINPDDIEREQFPPDDPATSGNRVYKYHSVAEFKKLASRPKQLTGQQDVDSGETKQEILSTNETQPTKSDDMAHVQECPF